MKDQTTSISFFQVLIIILSFWAIFYFLSSPSPPSNDFEEVSIEELAKTPQNYSYRYLKLKNVICKDGSFFFYKGFFRATDSTGKISFRVVSNSPPPEENQLIPELIVYVQPIYSDPDDSIYLLQQFDEI